MFLRVAPVAWFEHAVQLRMYRWNKFRSSLERNSESFGADWERRMVKEFGNSTDNSSEGGLGQYESVGRSNAPGRDAEGDSNDHGDDEEDLEEDLEKEIDETETQEKGVVYEG